MGINVVYAPVLDLASDNLAAIRGLAEIHQRRDLDASARRAQVQAAEAAVQAGTQSWSAFFFGSLDSANLPMRAKRAAAAPCRP